VRVLLDNLGSYPTPPLASLLSYSSAMSLFSGGIRKIRSGHAKDTISQYIDKQFNEFKNSTQRDYQQLLSAHENLRHRYEKLRSKFALYDAQKISITVDDEFTPQDENVTGTINTSLKINEIKEIVNNFSSEKKGQFMSLFGWDDVYAIVEYLTTNDLAVRNEEFYKILHAQTLPDIMSVPNSTDVDMYSRLLYTPYYEQYNFILGQLSRQRIELKKENEVHSNKQNIIRLIPGMWIRSFLNVFEQRQPMTTPLYPTPKNMKDIFFTEHMGYDAASSDDYLLKYLKDYAADIHYHLSRFMSVISSVLFLPLPEDRECFPKTSFTDIQLLIHYSVLFAESQYKIHGEKPISYRYFLQNEATMVLDTALINMLVTDGIECLLKTISKNSRFREYQREYIQLTNVKISDHSTLLEPSPVPPIPMNIFRSLIIENIHLYKNRLRRDTSEVNNWTLADESPIGQLINHDKTAVAEFNKIYRVLGPDVRSVAGNMYMEANKFMSMHRVYSYVLQCALAITLAAGKSDTLSSVLRHVLNRGIHSNGHHVSYGSTGDILPGLYYESILGIDVSTDEPNMEAKEYYECYPFRIKFFDLFGMYSSLIAPLSNRRENTERPREISARELTKLRLSNREAVSIVRAAMLNCFITLKHKRTKVSTKIKHFFKSSHFTADSTPIDIPVHIEANYSAPNGQLTFYSNPCIYRMQRGCSVKKSIVPLPPDIETANIPSHIRRLEEVPQKYVPAANTIYSSLLNQEPSLTTLSYVPA